jgi:hypothetical protein
MAIIEPTHLVYNLQIFTVPAVVLGTVLIVKLVELGLWPWKLQLALLVVALLYITAGPALQGVHLAVFGATIPMADLQSLIDVCKSDELTCVAIAPYHPIFCRDATDAYLGWDYVLAKQSWVSQAGQQVYRAMWPRAIADIQSKTPSFLVKPEIWQRIFKDGLIDQQELGRLQEVMQSRYQSVLVGNTPVLVRKDLLRSSGAARPPSAK